MDNENHLPVKKHQLHFETCRFLPILDIHVKLTIMFNLVIGTFLVNISGTAVIVFSRCELYLNCNVYRIV